MDKVEDMARENYRVGEILPAVNLFDLYGERVDLQNWQGNWTLLVFLRHLG